jgi:hypothetical protein
VDADPQRFTQKRSNAQQDTKTIGHQVSAQMVPGFPFFDQAETVHVLDVTNNTIADTPILFARRFDHGCKGLHDLQLVFRDYVQGNSNNDHCVPLSETEISTLANNSVISDVARFAFSLLGCRRFHHYQSNFMPDSQSVGYQTYL